MKLLTLLVTLPLALAADPIGDQCFPAPHPQQSPPGATPELWVSGCTSTGAWDAGYKPSQSGNGGYYYVYLATQKGTLAGYTAQFTFSTASPDNAANFGVVQTWGGMDHGTAEDPSNPDVITWDADHQVETITVPVKQIDINEQIASITLPAGVIAPPQITFLDITSARVQEAARIRAGVQCRFHDLRHSGCTRMLEAGVPFPVLAALMGWSAATTIRMAKRYGHVGNQALRNAVEAISGGTASEMDTGKQKPQGSFDNPFDLNSDSGSKVCN